MSLLTLQASSLSRFVGENLSRAGASVTADTARLSSGLRITRSADDIASLSVSSTLLRETTALSSSLVNLSQANTLLQVADAGLEQIEDIMQRMNAISTQASSGNLTNAERGFLDIEFQNLKNQIDDISTQTKFNGVEVLNGGNVSTEFSGFRLVGESVRGTDGNDVVETGITNDVIRSGAGNDTIRSGVGNDTIDAGTGIDNIDAGIGDDVITVDVANTDRFRQLTVRDGLALHLDASVSSSITANANGEVTGIADLSGNGNNATADANRAEIDESIMNGLASLELDGTDVIGVGDAAELNSGGQDERSIFVSFETGNDINSRQVIYEQGGGTAGFNLYIEGGKLYAGAWAGAGATFEIFLSTNIESNQSYNAGLVFDFTTTQTFKGYLNGSVFEERGLGATQVAHTGDIGIGGVNDGSYFANDGADASANSSEFLGEIGEVLNYDRALTQNEASDVGGYLLDKWRGREDRIEGGAGFDTVKLLNEGQSIKLGSSSQMSGVEYIDLNGNDTLHEIAIDDSYFENGDILNNTLYIDASRNSSAIQVDARGLSSQYQVIVLGSGGDDTLRGDGDSNNIALSYSHFNADGDKIAAGVEADLDFDELEAHGEDDALGVRNLIGSSGNDTLTGGQNGNILDGGDGDDLIRDIDISGGNLITGNQILFLDSTNEDSVTTVGSTITNVADGSGTGNNAFADVGAVQYALNSFNGQNAFSFDGSSNLGIADSASINTTGQTERSFFATFRTSADIITPQVIYEEGGPVNGYSFYVRAGRVFIGAFTNTGALNDIYVSDPIEPETAYVVGGVFNSNAGTLELYINGKLFSVETVNGPQNPHPDNIGVGGVRQNSRTDAGNLPTGNRFNGLIGEILLYDVALSGDQVLSLNNYLRALRFDGGNDEMIGGAGNDTLIGAQGNDQIDGGTGNDIAVYTGQLEDYIIERQEDGSIRVTDRVANRDFSDRLVNVETLRFSDQDVAIDSSQSGELSFAVNYNGTGTLDIGLPTASANALLGDRDISVATQEAAISAQENVIAGLDKLSAFRAEIGASQSSVDILDRATTSALQNQRAARGRLVDTDVVSTSTSYAQFLAQYQLSSTISAQTNTLKSTILLDILENGTNISPDNITG